MLKLFPAEMISPVGVKALKVGMPGTARLVPAGGITPYLAAGFGLGPALYRPGPPPKQTGANAAVFVAALRIEAAAGAPLR